MNCTLCREAMVVLELEEVEIDHCPSCGGMMHGAGYADYQNAFSKVTGKSGALIPPSGLRDREEVAIRKASPEKRKKPDKKREMRDVGDLMRAVNKYAFLVCVCGLKMKIPPDFKKPEVDCPRCKRKIEVPVAELAAVTAAVGTLAAERDKGKGERVGAEVPTYIRKSDGWESFSCSCGRLLQVSPLFSAHQIVCSDCGRKIEIKSQWKPSSASASALV